MKLPDKDAYEIEVMQCNCGGHIGIDSTFIEQQSHILLKCPYCGDVLDTRIFDAENGIIWLTRIEAVETLQQFAKDIEAIKAIRKQGQDYKCLEQSLNKVFNVDHKEPCIKYKIANNSVDFIKKD